MTVQEIKQAVNNGKTVNVTSGAYKVIVDNKNQWLIQCTSNNHCIGLTWEDGTTLNDKPENFYIT